MFRLERGVSGVPISNGWSLVFWFNFLCFFCDCLCLKKLFSAFSFCVDSSCSVHEHAVPRLLPAISGPWYFDESRINSVLNLFFGKFLCVGLSSNELCFFLSHLIFLDFLMFLLGKVVSRLLPAVREAWYLDQSVNNSADSFLLPSFVCVTVFFGISLWFFTHLILVAYVMFRLERGCSHFLPSNMWTLVLRAVSDKLLFDSFVWQVFMWGSLL